MYLQNNISVAAFRCKIAGICFSAGIFFSHANAQTRFIPSSSKDLQYQGRIIRQAHAAQLAWSGSSVTIYFKGKNLSAVMKDSDTANYYNVIIDDKTIFKIHTDTVKKSYLLFTGSSVKKHKVQLFKRTEWTMGKTSLYGFVIAAKSKILQPPPLPKRKIEFYGNSITCGYAMEDSSGGDSWHGYFENNYNSYASITARHFNAQYSCIAKSGIGIMVSWFPMIMPEMYDRLDPAKEDSKWNFNQYTPDIVVVNLFQNDSWLINKPAHEEFIHRFGEKVPDEHFIIDSYQSFIKTLRNKYPNANIICALGNMNAAREGSEWPGYIQQAVNQLHDAKIYTTFFAFKNTNGHPNTKEQMAMAESLISFINRKIKW